MGFWQDAADERTKRGITGETVGQSRLSFWNNLGKGAFDSQYKPIEVMGKGLGNAIGEFSGANQQIQDSTNQLVKTNNDSIKRLRDKLKTETDPSKIEHFKTAISQAAENITKALGSQSQFFDEAKAATDPGHIVNNAAQLAINVITAGSAAKAISGTGTAAKGLNAAQKVARAVLSPISAKEGALAFGGLGALQGGLIAGDTSGATGSDIMTGIATGGVMGAGAGALGGWLGGRNIRKMNIEDTANATKAAATMVDTPPGLVVNGIDTPNISSGVADSLPVKNVNSDIMPLSSQNAQSLATTPTENGRIAVSDLGKAAQMENPAMAVKPVDTPTPQQRTLDNFNANADSTYGKTTELINIDELQKYAEFDRKSSPLLSKEKYAALKADIAENGIKEPLILNYGAKDKIAYIGEGNHRLAIARELGITDIPVRVSGTGATIEGQGVKGFGKVNGATPDQFGYIPSNQKPSDIGIAPTPRVSKAVTPQERVLLQLPESNRNITVSNSKNEMFLYKPKSDEEYLALRHAIDGGDGKISLDGIPDKNGNKIHVTASNEQTLLSKGYKKVDTIPYEGLGDYKNMAAEITPGKTNEIAATIQMSDDQAREAIDALTQSRNGIKLKQADLNDLKGVGVSDLQLRENLGVDTTGMKLKPMKVKNTPPPEFVAPKGSLGEQIGVNLTDSAGKVSPEMQDLARKMNLEIEDMSKLMNSEYKSVPKGVKKALRGFLHQADSASNEAARLGGAPMADVVDSLQTGTTYRTNLGNQTKHYVDELADFSKEKLGVTGARQQVERVQNAIEKADISILKPGDEQGYKVIKGLWDEFKTEMVAKGYPVRDNYFSHVDLSSNDSAVGRVINAIIDNKSPNVESVFAKPRLGNKAGFAPDLKTLATKYRQGMLNQLSFRDAEKLLKNTLKDIPPSLANDPANMSQLRDFMSDLFKQVTGVSNETEISRTLGKGVDIASQNILRSSFTNAAKNPTDYFKIRSHLTKADKAVIVLPDILAESQPSKNFTYGNSMVSGAGTNPSLAMKAEQIADKISPNTRTEMYGVTRNWKDGMRKGIARSQVYLDAKASGLDDAAAQIKAWAEDRTGIIRQANQVAGTASAGNVANMPVALRNVKPLFGIVPAKSVTRFVSYPLNNTATFAREMIDPKAARAIEAFTSGNIKNASLANMKLGADTLVDMAKNMAKDPGINIPKDVMALKIKVLERARDDIDELLAAGSSISRGNTSATYAKIYGATIAVQMSVVGAQDTVLGRTGSDAKQKSLLATALQQNPFLDINRVINPVLNMSPVTTMYGTPQLSARGLTNLIPYAGAIDNATGNNMSTWLQKNVVKSVNSAASKAYK